MKLYAAVQIACHTGQSLQPATESRLKFGPGRHSHLDAPEGVEGLHEPCQHNLAVQSVVEALQKFAPELRVGICVNVHAHDDFRAAKLTE